MCGTEVFREQRLGSGLVVLDGIFHAETLQIDKEATGIYYQELSKTEFANLQSSKYTVPK